MAQQKNMLKHSPIAAVSWGKNRLDIFGIGTDKRTLSTVDPTQHTPLSFAFGPRELI